MSAEAECPNCGEMVAVDLEMPDESLVCEGCGEVFGVDIEELDRIKAEKEKDIEDLIDIDLALDGDLDGDLWG